MPQVKPIPDGYPPVTPYLICGGAASAIEFYKDVFGATETDRISGPDGKIGHAELRLGPSVIMLADEHPQMGMRGPKSIGATPVMMHVYVEDCDAVITKALAAGATLTRPLEDKFYGDRAGMITDPFGHIWNVSTRKEDLTIEEIKARAAKLFGG